MMAIFNHILFIFVILLNVHFISIQSFNSEEFDSYYKYALENKVHHQSKRNAEDDIVAKKVASTKKPTILTKPETQKSFLKGNKSLSKDHTTSNISLTFFDGELNETLPSNNTNEESHIYYNSTFYPEPDKAMSLWVNLTSFVNHTLVTHEMLSNSHRRAATVSLPFEFRFYGHPTTNITIATGGFLYVGDHVHSWLAATQYIAALMANFDTSLSNDSTIQYGYNNTAFVVQWSNVMLKDKNPDGKFTFQIILLDNGDIVFVYKDIPFSIDTIPDKSHPVKVGISDAYVIDKTVFFIRRKTIYEYHRADLKNYPISNNTAIYFKSLPTCIAISNCEECNSANIGFKCSWCDAVNRCSDGFDRHRQDWITKDCEKSSKDSVCLKTTSTQSKSTSQTPSSSSQSGSIASVTESHSSYHSPVEMPSGSRSNKGGGAAGGFVSIFVILSLLSGLGLWVFYAYRNPQTASGQLLIKYRFNNWRWRNSEARYTAASIHM